MADIKEMEKNTATEDVKEEAVKEPVEANLTEDEAEEDVSDFLSSVQEDDTVIYPHEFCEQLTNLSMQLHTLDGKDDEESNKERKEIESQYGKLLSSIIARTYVPVQMKRNFIQEMFDAAIVYDDDSFYLDEFLFNFNVRMAIIAMYTKLDITDPYEDGTDRDIFTVYDMLNQCGIIDALVDSLDESEMSELDAIAANAKQTFYNKYKTPEAYINRTLRSIKEYFGTLAEGFIEFIDENPDALADAREQLNRAYELFNAAQNASNTAAESNSVKDEVDKTDSKESKTNENSDVD